MRMRFLADENLEAPVVLALRGLGHDVLEVGVRAPGIEDEEVIALARRENRILITHDKDFGELVFLQRRRVPGILLIRLPRRSGRATAPLIAAAVATAGPRLRGNFVVAEPGRVRVRPLKA